MKPFRSLMAAEVECRVATCSDKGVSLLLYKDARCDMKILDETVGAENWQRKHDVVNGNLFCTVSIWDDEKKMWISKQDVGVESYTEKEKGQASDSFKRACVNWGIGRELYTAPFIWVSADKINMSQDKGRWTTREKFCVTAMEVEGGEITLLTIASAKTKKEVYSFGKKGQSTEGTPTTQQQTDKKPSDGQLKRMWAIAGKAGQDENSIHIFIKKMFKKESVKDLTEKEVNIICDRLEGRSNG
jgi:hypothetical protein